MKEELLHTEPVQRNYGIDLLRIISMMMVVMLHCLAHGGILRNTEALSIKYEVAWLFEILAYCAVNCYALISGYVGYGKKVKYSNIIYTVLQVTFYTLLFTTIFAVFAPETVSLLTWLKALLPIAYNVYWYITAYFCVFFFIPYLNQIVEFTSKSNIQKLIGTMIIMFCVLPIVYQVDIPNVKWGYSCWWLAFLYLVGAYIKKYGLFEKLNFRKLILGYVCCAGFTWLSRWGVEAITTRLIGTPKMEDVLIQYTSPTIFMCSVFLFLAFSKAHLNNYTVKIIRFFAPAAMGVYIIHLEPLVVEHLLHDAFSNYPQYSVIQMTLMLLGTVVIIWLVCSLIDKIRITLFDLLRVRNLCVRLENRLLKIVESFALCFNR